MFYPIINGLKITPALINFEGKLRLSCLLKVEPLPLTTACPLELARSCQQVIICFVELTNDW